MSVARKRIVGVTAAVALVAVAGTGVTLINARREPALPPIETPSPELAKFAATDAFRKLRLSEKEAYVRKLEHAYFDEGPEQFSNLTQDEISAIWRNMTEAAMDLRMKEYFALRSEAERKKFLDAEIDLMVRRVAQGLMRMMRSSTTQPAGTPDPAARPQFGPRVGGEGMTPQQQKGRLEETDSTRLAMMAEFMSAMRDRAVERGIPLGMPQPKSGR